MLQQTTVAMVVPRFARFLEKWPTVEALAAAPEEDILREWAGLGYYARARNLIACAREIVRAGGFPRTASGLRALPGIGPYTSAAIAAIAFGERAPAVDTNVERVIARLRGLTHPDRCDIERRALDLMAEHHPGDFIQAMMDLGATICRPANPRCSECPMRADCKAHASGKPEGYPARRQRRVRPHKQGTAFWTERKGRVWLVRRPAKGLLGGMAALPGDDWSSDNVAAHGAIGTVRHVFTHFVLDLAVVRRADPLGQGWWQPIDRLGEAGLPTLYRRAAELALSAPQQPRAAA